MTDKLNLPIRDSDLRGEYCFDYTQSRPYRFAFSDASSLRILLWDIDGTLMRSAQTGSYKDYFVPMLERVFQTSGCLHEMQVSGMTDLQIVAEALRGDGFTPELINQRLDHLRECYMDEMRKATGNGKQFFQLLPGARELLQALADHPRYHSGLLTGNIEPAAQLKMELVGLAGFFDIPGAFGDESHDRRDLPALAANRIRKHLQFDFAPEQFIVIGDTPNDIACAKHFGAKSLAVGTGRLFTREEVLACNPDAFVPDLSDVHRTLKILSEM
ncbi:MAG TPA: HAD hydrolase-like protein [Pyrinomonadaceae bacterium]|nr:HAD hydrolase-like protein [Pyrinomonadaceae bacterium]